MPPSFGGRPRRPPCVPPPTVSNGDVLVCSRHTITPGKLFRACWAVFDICFQQGLIVAGWCGPLPIDPLPPLGAPPASRGPVKKTATFVIWKHLSNKDLGEQAAGFNHFYWMSATNGSDAVLSRILQRPRLMVWAGRGKWKEM